MTFEELKGGAAAGSSAEGQEAAVTASATTETEATIPDLEQYKEAVIREYSLKTKWPDITPLELEFMALLYQRGILESELQKFALLAAEAVYCKSLKSHQYHYLLSHAKDAPKLIQGMYKLLPPTEAKETVDSLLADCKLEDYNPDPINEQATLEKVLQWDKSFISYETPQAEEATIERTDQVIGMLSREYQNPDVVIALKSADTVQAVIDGSECNIQKLDRKFTVGYSNELIIAFNIMQQLGIPWQISGGFTSFMIAKARHSQTQLKGTDFHKIRLEESLKYFETAIKINSLPQPAATKIKSSDDKGLTGYSKVPEYEGYQVVPDEEQEAPETHLGGAATHTPEEQS